MRGVQLGLHRGEFEEISVAFWRSSSVNTSATVGSVIVDPRMLVEIEAIAYRIATPEDVFEQRKVQWAELGSAQTILSWRFRP